MAVLGRVNTYGTVENTPDYIGNAMNVVEQNAFRYRAEKAAAEKAKKDEEDKKALELENHKAKFKVDLTGNSSIDDLTTSYAREAVDRYAENHQKIQQTTNPAERARMMNENSRNLQSFEILKQVPSMLNAKVAEIAKGVEEGKYNSRDVDAIQETMKQLETGKAKLYIDQFGQPRVNIYKTDENNKITEIIAEEKTIAQLIKETTPFVNPEYGKIKENFLKNNQLSETEIQNGLTTETKKRVDDRIRLQAKKQAEAVVSNDSEMYELWVNMGNPSKRDFTKEDREKAAKYVEDDLVNSYGETYKKEVDMTEARLAREAREKKKLEEDKPIVTTVDKTPFIEDVYSSKGTGKKNITVSKEGILPKGVAFKKGIPIQNVGGQDSELDNLNIKAVYMNKDGRIVYTGTVLDLKASGDKTVTKNEGGDNTYTYKYGEKYKRVTRTASAETEAAIASKMEFESTDALKDYFRKLNPDNPAPKPTIQGGNVR